MRKLVVGCVALVLLALATPAGAALNDNPARIIQVSARSTSYSFTIRAVAQDDGTDFATMVMVDPYARTNYRGYPDGSIYEFTMSCAARLPDAPPNYFLTWTGPDTPSCEYYDLPVGSLTATYASFWASLPDAPHSSPTWPVNVSVCVVAMAHIRSFTSGDDCRLLTVWPNQVQIIR